MNLTALRHYRRQLEDILRAELAVLERALQTSAARSLDLNQTVAQTAEAFQAALCRGLSGDEMIDRTRELESVTIAARHAVTLVAEARQRWEQKRADVLEAARERKTLEFLESRRLQQRMTRLRRLEQQGLDEAAHIRFLRSARDGARHGS
jgi:flagellar export protein FliJ